MLHQLYFCAIKQPKTGNKLAPAMELLREVEAWQEALPEYAKVKEGFVGPIVTQLHMLAENITLLAFRPHFDTEGTKPSPRNRCLDSAKTICRFLQQYKTYFGLRVVSLVMVYEISNAATIFLLSISNATQRKNPATPSGLKEVTDLLELCITTLEEIGANGWKSSTRAAKGLRQLQSQAAPPSIPEPSLPASQTSSLGLFGEISLPLAPPSTAVPMNEYQFDPFQQQDYGWSLSFQDPNQVGLDGMDPMLFTTQTPSGPIPWQFS